MGQSTRIHTPRHTTATLERDVSVVHRLEVFESFRLSNSVYSFLRRDFLSLSINRGHNWLYIDMTLKVAGILLTYTQIRQLGSFVKGEPLEDGPAFDVFYDEAKNVHAEILPVDYPRGKNSRPLLIFSVMIKNSIYETRYKYKALNEGKSGEAARKWLTERGVTGYMPWVTFADPANVEP
ncbi:hypothetical protein BJ138DRAFT_1161902 [Hygrophoropsis aurantiaca]|uniref:Uncharacterized protein n=1 Tax=Hygrophoropsis aurantiaca TaxID=72124 RepID=A0ACB8A0J0_9AGAM|nr:hypothetical protein BJ138DRAFT_1161902 [Hygrophoropsis aurantiaca]